MYEVAGSKLICPPAKEWKIKQNFQSKYMYSIYLVMFESYN